MYGYTVDRYWLRPLLWQIWRLGGVGSNERPLIRFLQSHQLSFEILNHLCVQGYLETGVRPPDLSYELTEKGLDFVLEAEEPKWRERLVNVFYPDPVSEALEAALKLRTANVSLRIISDVTKRNAQDLLDNYDYEVKRNARVNAEIKDFVEGRSSLKVLSISPLFHTSPALINLMHKGQIYTLVELLGLRISDLYRKRGLGTNYISRIKDRLAEYDESLEP